MQLTIHFIYGLWDNDTPLPVNYLKNLKQWKTLNPNYITKIWNKSMILNLIKVCPKWGWLLNEKLSPIQYCDIARILIVLRHGGVYSDLDVFPVKSLDELMITEKLKNNKSIIGIEFPLKQYKIIKKDNLGKRYLSVIISDKRGPNLKYKSQPNLNLPKIRNNIPERLPRIANYFFGSPPGHKYLTLCLSLIAQRIKLPINIEYDIIYTTGPDIFSEAFNLTNTSSLFIISHNKFKSSLQHQCSSSWRWEK